MSDDAPSHALRPGLRPGNLSSLSPGVSPAASRGREGRGVGHTGDDRSVGHHVADPYKAELSMPAAFDSASQDLADVPGSTRRHMRDLIHAERLLERCVRDVRHLLLPGDHEEDDEFWVDVIELWDDRSGTVAAGTNYADSEW